MFVRKSRRSKSGKKNNIMEASISIHYVIRVNQIKKACTGDNVRKHTEHGDRVRESWRNITNRNCVFTRKSRRSESGKKNNYIFFYIMQTDRPR